MIRRVPLCMCFWASIVVSALLCCHPLLAASQPGHTESRRPFRVQDAIEISYIIDAKATASIEEQGAFPRGRPIISPDGKRFLLITQRGVLSTNKIEATLWLFALKAVVEYALHHSVIQPRPTIVARLSAPSNTAVISTVRWIDCNRVAFLGKDGSRYQELFIADLKHKSIIQVTREHAYVTAYDMRGHTVAYTTLSQEREVHNKGLLDITGQPLTALLFRASGTNIGAFSESWTLSQPSILHIHTRTKNLSAFALNDKPLNLFRPLLSLSPDGNSLITIATVESIPLGWSNYHPGKGGEFLRLAPTAHYVPTPDNPWKVSQYVRVDVVTGKVSPLIDAPAGRSLVLGAPATAFWLGDSRRVIVASTFLPASSSTEPNGGGRCQDSAIAIVDVVTGVVHSAKCLDPSDRITNVSFDSGANQLKLRFVPVGEGPGISNELAYDVDADKWEPTSSGAPDLDADHPVDVFIQEDLNQPPVLRARVLHETEPHTVWDPNPQLKEIKMGTASLYSWQDSKGRSWDGILILPADYEPQGHYPLVIQTHGHDRDRFFADGPYTTGSPGRSLAAKGVVVLQIGMLNIGTPDEGSTQLEGIRSAINNLQAGGIIDASRVGIIGFSRTCFHVLYALTQRPDLLAAASITDGLNFSYLQYLFSVDRQADQDLAEHINGGQPFGEGLKKWVASAPGFGLFKVRTPLLITALEKGELLWEWEIYSVLRTLDKPVDMLWWSKQDTPHILVQPLQRYASQQSTIDWFDFWLNGREDADPAKAERYERWRELRRQAQKQKSRSDKRF